MTIEAERVAVVTGSSRGIGAAVAVGLAQDGYAVVVSSRHADALQPVSERIRAAGGVALPVVADLRDPQQIATLFAAVDREFGRLDVLVSNAGIGTRASTQRQPLRDWERIVALNLTAPFLCGQQAAARMRPNSAGVIVNVSSVFGAVGAPARAAYVATKHGLVGLTKVQASEWARDGVRVVAVAPSYIATEGVSSFAASGVLDAPAIVRRTPMGRLGTSEEVADVIRFLVGHGARYVTGSVVYVDGGWLAVGDY